VDRNEVELFRDRISVALSIDGKQERKRATLTSDAEEAVCSNCLRVVEAVDHDLTVCSKTITVIGDRDVLELASCGEALMAYHLITAAVACGKWDELLYRGGISIPTITSPAIITLCDYAMHERVRAELFNKKWSTLFGVSIPENELKKILAINRATNYGLIVRSGDCGEWTRVVAAYGHTAFDLWFCYTVRIICVDLASAAVYIQRGFLLTEMARMLGVKVPFNKYGTMDVWLRYGTDLMFRQRFNVLVETALHNQFG